MKRLTPYSGNCFEFHEEIVERKREKDNDPTYKNRLNILNNKVEMLFQHFEEEFQNNNLDAIRSNGYSGQDFRDLQSLYSYRSKKIQSLKKELTTDENNRVDNTCQNCTINEINSFDHYFPQSNYAEFIVNPHNLIPSCTKCNAKKNNVIFKNGHRIFINHYKDVLPDVQYLFVDIIIHDNIEVVFHLDNINNIDDEVFQLITSHYTCLDLLTRFQLSSNNIISELDTEIRNYSSKLPIETIQQVVLQQCSDCFRKFGKNHWKYILKKSLIEDSDFLDRFRQL